MILAGIDEAGYGPVLGPLVVGGCAFEVDTTESEPPCLWKVLAKVLSKKRDKSGRRLHVNDSKLVYSASSGLKELERSVLAFASAAGKCPGSLDELLSFVAAESVADLREHPWYDERFDGGFPLDQGIEGIRIFGRGLAQGNSKCVYLSARVLPEKQFNRQVNATRNKGSVNFGLVAFHIDRMLRQFGNQNLVLYCDRQGGRERYGHLLRVMFEDWDLGIVKEEEGYAEYLLTQGQNVARLIFCEQAETKCLSVALASMLSKYLRESLMGRFNAFWRKMLPNLEPTAGYYTDGMRFLNDIAPKRQELRIADEHLVRVR